MLQTPYKLASRAIPVDFGVLAHRSSRYLLPTRLAIAPNGRASLHLATDSDVRTDLKVGLMGRATDDDTASAAMFIALVLRECRRFFLVAQRADYGPDRLRWSFNLGIPSAGYDDDVIRSRFLRVARLGWLLSLSDEPPTPEKAFQHVASTPVEAELAINVIPEVAAEVVGYARSPHRREGLHVMFDLGASTLDVSAFCLHRQDGDDHRPILTADVQVLGLLSLHRRRAEAASGAEPFERIPGDSIEPLPNWSNDHPAASALADCDERYIEQCGRRVLFRTLADLHMRRDPYSPRWTEGLPIFMGGGGCAAPISAQVLKRADSIAHQIWDRYAGLRRQRLPVPASLATTGAPITEEEFARIAVAYGLSFPEIDIGIIEPPSTIPDIDTSMPQNPWRDLLD
jgi:hypothetical protein